MLEVEADVGKHVLCENLEINGRFMAICDMILCKAELTFFSIYVYIEIFKAFLHNVARL